MAHALNFLLVFHLLIFLSNPIAILAAGSTNNSEIDWQALLNFTSTATISLRGGHFFNGGS
jgi:hypothetical protein